jgi:branched-chain amino acid transport system ATP-binding protein
MVGSLGAAAAGVGGAFLALYSLSALPPSYATLNGLIWLAIVVTLGARSSGAALMAGMSFTIIPGLFLQYLSPTISEVPAAMFGIGAILVARNPDGILAMHRRQFSSLLSRWRTQDNVDDPIGRMDVLQYGTDYVEEATSRRVPLDFRLPVESSLRPKSRVASESEMGTGTHAFVENMTGLRAEGVSVRFGGVLALSNVSIEVPRNRITAIVGPNGAGKSTLFAVLSGFQTPETGRVWLDGAEVSSHAPRDRARRGLARTFQQPELFWTMTPREHLVLGYRAGRDPSRVWRDWLAIRKVRYGDEGDCVRWILGLLGLEDVADRNVAELPLGMGRLVEVGRAIAAFPKVLLLDEPCAGLDQRETNELARVLQRLVVDEGTGILLVEHDLEMVMRIAHEVVVLDHGAVIARGSAEHVRNDPAVRTAYLGTELSLRGGGD